MDDVIFLIDNMNFKDIAQYGILAIVPIIGKYIVNKIKIFVEDINQKFENLAKLQVEHLSFYREYLERKTEIDKKIENIMLENERKNLTVISMIDALNSHWNCYKEAGVAVLKDRLSQSLRYFLKQGHVGIDAKRNIDELIRVYILHNDNKDTVVPELYERFKLLPIDDINDIDIDKIN